MSFIEDGSTIRNFTDEDARRLVKAGAGAAESIQVDVHPTERKVVMHPAGTGFFTLDRARGGVPIVVTEYRIDPHDLDKTVALKKLFSDWIETYPVRTEEPKFDEFGIHVSRQGEPMTAGHDSGYGSAVSVVALRGKTPVSMVFAAR